MHEWPLIIFTLLVQGSVGITLFLTCRLIFGNQSLNMKERNRVSLRAMLIAFVAGALGLMASTAHLGYPLNAFHALSHIGSSWLSREIVFASLYLGALGLATLIAMLTNKIATVLLVMASLIGIVDIFCMSAIYVHASVVTWMHFNTYVMFYGTALSLGSLGGLWMLAACRSLPLASAKKAAMMTVGVLITVSLLRLLEQPVYLSYLAGHNGNDVITFPHQPLVAFGQMSTVRLWAWGLLVVGVVTTAFSLRTLRINRALLSLGGAFVLIAEALLRLSFFSIQ